MSRKPIDKTKTLVHARAKGNVDGFIREHEKDEPGDLDKLEEAIRRPQGQESGSEAPKASPKASSDD